MSYSVEGRVALVTGGGRGLGRSLVRELLARGARVVAVDRAIEPLEELQQLAAETSARLSTRRLDVTDRSAVEGLRRELGTDHGRVEILINNAGVVHGGVFTEVALEDHLDTVAVNLGGVLVMTHTFLPDLCRADAGRLVNIASASGFIGLPWGVSYSATKWAVVGLSEGLRQELAARGHHNVAVTVACPAYIDTGLFHGVKPPRLIRSLSPDAVARRTLVAMCRGRRRLLVPWLARSAPWMVALPSWLGDRLSRVLGVASSMRSWRGR